MNVGKHDALRRLRSGNDAPQLAKVSAEKLLDPAEILARHRKYIVRKRALGVVLKPLERNAGPEGFQSLRTLAIATRVDREGCAQPQALSLSPELTGL